MGEYYNQIMRNFDRALDAYENEEQFDAEVVDEPEYLEFRCCMCPNTNSPESRVCPARGPTKTTETPCRFVKNYITRAGALAMVVRTGEALYDVKFRNSLGSWLSRKKFSQFDDAQADLNSFAKRCEWEEV